MKLPEIFVGNFSYTMSRDDLLFLFQDYPGITLRVFQTDPVKCFALIQCVNDDQVAKIVSEMSNADISGRNLIVRPSKENSRSKSEKISNKDSQVSTTNLNDRGSYNNKSGKTSFDRESSSYSNKETNTSGTKEQRFRSASENENLRNRNSLISSRNANYESSLTPFDEAHFTSHGRKASTGDTKVEVFASAAIDHSSTCHHRETSISSAKKELFDEAAIDRSLKNSVDLEIEEKSSDAPVKFVHQTRRTLFDASVVEHSVRTYSDEISVDHDFNVSTQSPIKLSTTTRPLDSPQKFVHRPRKSLFDPLVVEHSVRTYSEENMEKFDTKFPTCGPTQLSTTAKFVPRPVQLCGIVEKTQEIIESYPSIDADVLQKNLPQSAVEVDEQDLMAEAAESFTSNQRPHAATRGRSPNNYMGCRGSGRPGRGTLRGHFEPHRGAPRSPFHPGFNNRGAPRAPFAPRGNFQPPHLPGAQFNHRGGTRGSFGSFRGSHEGSFYPPHPLGPAMQRPPKEEPGSPFYMSPRMPIMESPACYSPPMMNSPDDYQLPVSPFDQRQHLMAHSLDRHSPTMRDSPTFEVPLTNSHRFRPPMRNTSSRCQGPPRFSPRSSDSHYSTRQPSFSSPMGGPRPSFDISAPVLNPFRPKYTHQAKTSSAEVVASRPKPDSTENVEGSDNNVTASPPARYNLCFISVANFPSYTTTRELFNLFADFEPHSIQMLCNQPREDGKYTEATVSFRSEDVAQDFILTFDNTEYNGKQLIVTEPLEVDILCQLQKLKLNKWKSPSTADGTAVDEE